MLRLHGVPTDKFSTQLQFCSAFYLQIDGQTKAVNCTLSNVLCCVGIDKQQNEKATLAKVEFTYNNVVNQSTIKTPFEIVYTCSTHDVYDLHIMLTIVGGSKA